MFSCERCGSSFNATVVAAVENCPRCKAREGIAAPLTFRLFSQPPAASGASRPPGSAEPSEGAEAGVR
jgi:hypothetical protein